MRPYKSEEGALKDVLRLSRGMTYKAAVAGLRLGGGKAVIIGDPVHQKNEDLLEAFGRFVESHGGKYITAEDVGTSVSDMDRIKRETKHVVGTSERLGGSGDPSQATAYGVYVGMKICVQEIFCTDSFLELKVAIQGVGKVGYHLAKYLHNEGAELFVADTETEKVKVAVRDFEAQPLDIEKIYDVNAEVLAPCALGGVINDNTIGRLRCKIIAGAANNQLEVEERHGNLLYRRDMLYTPDYAINAGGLINVYDELQPEGYTRDRAFQRIDSIADVIREIIRISRAERISTHIAARRIAEENLRRVQDKRE
jgi:leucine dehydrogenase